MKLIDYTVTPCAYRASEKTVTIHICLEHGGATASAREVGVPLSILPAVKKKMLAELAYQLYGDLTKQIGALL